MQMTVDNGATSEQSFYQAFRKAQEVFENSSAHSTEMVFDGISLLIYRASVYNDICTIYDLKRQIRRMKDGE